MTNLRSGRPAVPVTTLLESGPTKPLAQPRTTAVVAAAFRELVATGRLDLPLPAAGRTARRWGELAALGRSDLTLARLAEGHADALAILAEAGRPAVPGAGYGVWAARSGGTGAALADADGGRCLNGTVRFCSGATTLDRALVAAVDDTARGRLVEIDLTDPRVHRDPESWQAIGMAASDSLDVRFDGIPVSQDMLVGPPGWYVSRPGFLLGGAGVAAVWLGGAAGVLDAVVSTLADAPATDEHQMAKVGTLSAVLRAADALLTATAHLVDHTGSDVDLTVPVSTAKAAVERAAWDMHDLVPRITGPTPLCRDRQFAARLADLAVYVRQHHAERELAALGTAVVGIAAAAR